jgi:3'-5' exoribonuclease
MFPEALMLHYLDDLDSKMESMRAHEQRDGSDGAWTGYNPSLGRSVLKTAKFLEKKPIAPPPVEGRPSLDSATSEDSPDSNLPTEKPELSATIADAAVEKV